MLLNKKRTTECLVSERTKQKRWTAVRLRIWQGRYGNLWVSHTLPRLTLTEEDRARLTQRPLAVLAV